MEHSTEKTKRTANKISDTVAELYVPQNHDPNFPKLNQMEEQKTVHMNHSNTENYNKTFSKEELVTKKLCSWPRQDPQ